MLLDIILNAKKEINNSINLNSLKLIRIKYFGKKSFFNQQISKLWLLPLEKKLIIGKLINQFKKDIMQMLIYREKEIKKKILNFKLVNKKLDVSLPGRCNNKIGSLHPLSITIYRIEKFFCSLGFSIVYGNEIEDEYNNFTALNIPFYHPARSINDTFWFDTKKLLRTQTSSIQVCFMKKNTPPIRIVSPGRVYRNDYDQTHTPMFHQIEGLAVDYNLNFAKLKGTLYKFLYYFFEKKIKIRFRPSYFPFTQISAEADIIGENGKWIEVLGCGMVHSNVLRNANIDSNLYSGFAFGIGIERITMLYYGITDLRIFFENDLRFLRQFK